VKEQHAGVPLRRVRAGERAGRAFVLFEGYVAFSLTAATALAILLEHEQPKRGGGFA
jgi:hypothetical protein